MTVVPGTYGKVSLNLMTAVALCFVAQLDTLAMASEEDVPVVTTFADTDCTVTPDSVGSAASSCVVTSGANGVATMVDSSATAPAEEPAATVKPTSTPSVVCMSRRRTYTVVTLVTATSAELTCSVPATAAAKRDRPAASKYALVRPTRVAWADTKAVGAAMAAGGGGDGSAGAPVQAQKRLVSGGELLFAAEELHFV